MIKFLNFPKVEKRTFNYKPRFYDADREALEERIRGRQARTRTDQDDALDEEDVRRERVSAYFENYRRGRDKTKKQGFLASNARFLLLWGGIAAAIYFSSDKLIGLMDHFLFPEKQEIIKEEELPPLRLDVTDQPQPKAPAQQK